METVCFYIFALLALTGAVSVITQRNPIYSAISLIVTLFAVAGLYLLLYAQFVAIIQVLVYAGAIMVLFLFVVMLLNLGTTPDRTLKLLGLKIAGGIATGMLLLIVISMLLRGYQTGVPGDVSPERIIAEGSTELIGRALFTTYVLPFEIVSVLLLVAMIGVVVLAKRPKEEEA